MGRDFQFPVKTAVIGLAAIVFAPFVIDWVSPGAGTHCAVGALGIGNWGSGVRGWTVWGWLVGRIGKDVVGLGILSMAGALISVGLIAQIVGDMFDMAIRRGKQLGVQGEGEFAGLRNTAVVIGALAFALTPGFLRAATRMGPLMPGLVAPLGALAILVWLLARGGDVVEIVTRFKRCWYLVLLAFILVGYSIWEWWPMKRVLLSEWMSFTAFALVGMIPALTVAAVMRMRWVVNRTALVCIFGAWALAVASLGLAAGLAFDRGRDANRVTAAIIENLEGRGKVAVASDGMLDDLFFFMLPEKIKLITLARDHDPAYGRELAAWVGERGEDLAFAAELGPAALIDEWQKTDKAGFEAAVATFASYFPTVEKWREACGIVGDEAYLRRLMGRAGNALGCTLIERGDLAAAWAVFKEIGETVDCENYTAFLNRVGMLERGYKVAKSEADEVTRRCGEMAKRLGTTDMILAAAASGGQLYLDPESVARREKARIERMRNRELTNREKALVAALTEPPESVEACKIARATVERGVKDGVVRVDRVGHQLITLDFGIGDWELAERDAIRVLREDRHHATANAAMGAINGSRGDYEAAERYLRRGMREEGRGKSAIVLNDLAFTLARLGRAKEALPLAREAVAATPGNWNFRETLAYALIRAGEAEEGERELARAEESAEKAGRAKGEIVRFEIDRAWIFAAKGDKLHRNISVRGLRGRQDLTASQRRELDEIAKRD